MIFSTSLVIIFELLIKTISSQQILH